MTARQQLVSYLRGQLRQTGTAPTRAAIEQALDAVPALIAAAGYPELLTGRQLDGLTRDVARKG